MGEAHQASKCRIKDTCVQSYYQRVAELKCSSREHIYAYFTNTDLVSIVNKVFFPRFCWYIWLLPAQNKILAVFYNCLQGFQYGLVPAKLYSHQKIRPLFWAVLYLDDIYTSKSLINLPYYKFIADCGYSSIVPSKHTLGIELIQCIKIS